MFLRKIFGGSVRSVVAANTASQILAKVFGAGATFLISIMVARAYGTQGYGDFTKIITYFAFFFLFSDFGLNAVYLQRRSIKIQEKNETNQLWPTLVSLRLLGSIVLIILALVILAILPHGTEQGYTSFVRTGILIFIPAILFQSMLTTANAYFQERFRYDLSAVAVGAGSVVAIIVAFVLMPTAAFGTLSGVLAIFCGILITAGCAVYFVRRLGASLSLATTKVRMVELLRRAFPLGLTLIFNVIYFRADSFILTLTRATEEVGIYGFAYKVFEVPLVFPTFFMNSMYPLLLAEVRKSDNSGEMQTSGRFRRLIVGSLFVMIVSSILMVIFLYVASPLLPYIRHEFSASIEPLRVLSLSAPFFFLTSLTMWVLIALGKQKILAWIYAVLMIFNILLNIVFVPRYGYMAAAWITFVSEGVVFLVSGVFVLSVLYKKNYRFS